MTIHNNSNVYNIIRIIIFARWNVQYSTHEDVQNYLNKDMLILDVFEFYHHYETNVINEILYLDVLKKNIYTDLKAPFHNSDKVLILPEATNYHMHQALVYLIF